MRSRLVPLVLFVLGGAATAACALDATVLHEAPAPAPLGDGGAADAPGVARGDGAPRPTTDAFGVFLGQSFSCALVAGAGYCWGSNVQGALGTGDAQSRLSPAPIAGALVFDVLSAGENHACGIEHDTGRVHCWGYAAHGQLGQGDTTTHLAPVAVTLPAPALQLSAGYNHTCAVLATNELYCWGEDFEGQLGQNDPFDTTMIPSPARVGTDADWKTVAGGQGHTCAVKRDGSLWCWGRNTSSELGLGDGQPGQIRVPTRVGTDTDWNAIDLGQDEGCGVVADHSLRCWGSGGAGNLDGAGGPLKIPTRIGAANDWESVSVDVFATCAVNQANRLFCWGRNAEGQLGLGDITDRTTPTEVGAGTSWAMVSVGRFHMCAEASDHTVRCTGANESGQLGLGDTDRRNVTTAVTFPPPSAVP